MKKIVIILTSFMLLVLASCYRDLGNYEYKDVTQPVVTNLDTVYTAIVGDSLIIAPQITIQKENPDLSYAWSIEVPEELRSVDVSGPELRIIFGLGAKRYFAKLVITDNTNGLKYFHFFAIDGQTSFSEGMTVLSNEGGSARLSFIKSDGSVLADIYPALHNGEVLQGKPRQVIPMLNQFNVPLAISSYWITSTDAADPGVQIDANTFKKVKSFRENFFEAPATTSAGIFENAQNGVLLGVVNGKLYTGTSQTWSGSPVYGMFGLPAEGDYSLFDQAVFHPFMPYFLGYDKVKKQFVAFTNFGSAAYVGIGYETAGTDAFDPKSVGLDLLFFHQINANNCFAIGKDEAGNLFELKFGAAFMGFVQLSPIHKRPFVRPELVLPSTQWASTPAEIFYFTSGSKVYRYNPLNEEVRALDTDFGGKEVSMIKVYDNGNTLVAGVEGSIYVLDISTGKFGDIISKTDDIPGTPVDVAIRKP